jgi:tetratricopeptide (TPR) repeat protein
VFYQTDPTSTPLAWYTGLAWFRMNDPVKASLYFREALKYNPYHIHVLNNLASSCVSLGENDYAIGYYKKAVTIAPNFDEAWLNLCAVYYNQKQYEKAYGALIKVNLYTREQRYRPFIKAITKSLIRNELLNFELQDSIVLPEDEEWYFDVFIQMRNDKRSLKNIIFEQDFPNQTNRLK